jgi:hypothetical protein
LKKKTDLLTHLYDRYHLSNLQHKDVIINKLFLNMKPMDSLNPINPFFKKKNNWNPFKKDGKYFN